MANYAALEEGVVISATPFVGAKSFNIGVLSSFPVANGGSAKIFLGRSDQPRRFGETNILALKLFVNNMTDFQQQLLNRELRAVRHIQHPYIVPYLGTAVIGFHHILISPYMKNGNLLDFLSRNPGIDRRPLIIHVASAVLFLHTEHGLVHGDLKCENVLVTDDRSAQLADFGLSTYIERTETSTTTASVIRQQMSIQFAAPELVLGAEPPTPTSGRERPARRTAQTDVYAFGMLVIQAYTGRPPWPDCNVPQILMNLYLQVPHPRPENAVPPIGLTDVLWNICLECSTIEPAKRPTMQRVCDLLLVPPQPPESSVADDLSSIPPSTCTWPSLCNTTLGPMPQEYAEGEHSESDRARWEQPSDYSAALPSVHELLMRRKEEPADIQPPSLVADDIEMEELLSPEQSSAPVPGGEPQ